MCRKCFWPNLSAHENSKCSWEGESKQTLCQAHAKPSKLPDRLLYHDTCPINTAQPIKNTHVTSKTNCAVQSRLHKLPDGYMLNAPDMFFKHLRRLVAMDSFFSLCTSIFGCVHNVLQRNIEKPTKANGTSASS